MSTGQKVSELEWQKYKAEIETLYIKDDQTLEKVMALMEERHAFSARLSPSLFGHDTSD